MEKYILTDPTVIPLNDVMEKTLGEKYLLYKEFVEKINEKKLILGWSYVEKSKTWVGIIRGAWEWGWSSVLLSHFYVMETGFEVSVGTFSEKEMSEILELDISDSIKLKIMEKEPRKSMLFNNHQCYYYSLDVFFENKETMNDAVKLLEYRLKAPPIVFLDGVQPPNQMIPKTEDQLSGELDVLNDYYMRSGKFIYKNKGNDTVEIEIQIEDFASWKDACYLKLFSLVYFLLDLDYEKILLTTKTRYIRLQKLYEVIGFVKTKVDNKTIYYELTKKSVREYPHYRDIILRHTNLTSKKFKINENGINGV